MRHYKIYTNFTNYISITENELEKALRAFQEGVGVIFENGATQRIESILPDNVKMMGWNDGYKPTSEELGEISRDSLCLSARNLMSEIKTHIALGNSEPFKQLENPVKKHTNGPTSLGDLLPPLTNP